MEHPDRAPVSTFHAPGAWGPVVELDEAAAHHASVKRLKLGDVVRLTSGDGRRARATITDLGKHRLSLALDGALVERIAAPSHVELWAPVGDRERMLLLAEKAVELGLSAWRPISYRRSRSVSPRGEGEAFREKLRLRMISALEQSGGAWLPEQFAEMSLDVALQTTGASHGILLDADGEPFTGPSSPFTIHQSPFTGQLAVGPEGGLEPEERELFLAAGWRPASLGANVLRFETAAIAALAIVRSLIG